MKAKNTVLRLAGAAMVTLAIAPWMGGGTASAAAPATYNATLKTSHQGVTAAGFPSKQTDCAGWSPTEGTDSFHFVVDGNFVFTSLTVQFSTGTITTTTFGPPTGKHAYVEAPAGATLVNAWATVSPPPEKALDFQLSHVCVGKPVTSSSPPVTSSSPPVTSSSPPVTSSSPPVTSSSPPVTSSSPPVTSSSPPVTSSSPPVTSSSPPVTSSSPPVTSSSPPVTSSSPPVSVSASQSASVLPTKAGNTTSAAAEETDTAVLGTQSGALPQTGVRMGLLVGVSLGLLLGGSALLMLPGLKLAKGGQRRH